MVDYLDLGELPLANGLLEKKRGCDRYSLQVMFCRKCSLSQLSLVVDPKILYHNYPYRSSMSKTFKRHCYDLAKTLKKEYMSRQQANCYCTGDDYDIPQPTVVDIGANDGCLLREFSRLGIKALAAIEPDSSMNDLIGKDTPVINNFFPDGIPGAVRLCWNSMSIGANFSTATNVLAHTDDLSGFVSTLSYVINPYGMVVIEVPHVQSLIENMEFDTIYHEHLSYFTLKSLLHLFAGTEMRIFRAERISIHGGSIRIYADFKQRVVESSVEELLLDEAKAGFHELARYESFNEKVKNVRTELLARLEALKEGGKRILAFGASAKGCTLLNYCDIGEELVDYVIDDTPSKQGKFIPGVCLEIKPYDYHDLCKTDAVLLLAWNFKREIMPKINASGYKGDWILPVEDKVFA